jgi:hypothetical protein
MFIDTLKFKTQLLEGGFEEGQAQALVDAFSQAATEDLATKTDVQAVRTEIEKLRGDTQASMENLRGQMTHIKWMITALWVVNVGILGKLLFT